MAARFVIVDRDTPMLLPPDLRDWVPSDSPARLVVELVDHLDLSTARVNHTGSGSEQYPPSMMLALLLFSYSQGVFKFPAHRGRAPTATSESATSPETPTPITIPSAPSAGATRN